MSRLMIACFAISLFFVPAAMPQEKTADGWTVLLGPGVPLESNWTTKGNWVLDKDGVVELKPRPGEQGWERWNMYLWAKQQKCKGSMLSIGRPSFA